MAAAEHKRVHQTRDEHALFASVNSQVQVNTPPPTRPSPLKIGTCKVSRLLKNTLVA